MQSFAPNRRPRLQTYGSVRSVEKITRRSYTQEDFRMTLSASLLPAWSNLLCNWKRFKQLSAERPSPVASLTRWKKQQFSWASGIETWGEIRPELNVPSTCFLPQTGQAQPYLFFIIIPLPPNMLVKGTSWKLTLHMWFSWRLQTPEHLEGTGTKLKMCLPHEKGPGGRILSNWEPLAGVWLCWLLGHCASVLQTAWTSGSFHGIWIVF